MTIKNLTDHLEEFDKDHKFNFRLSDPFQWEGNHSDIAFTLIREETTTRELLAFFDYYSDIYDEDTHIHFEAGEYEFSDGEYCIDMVQEINGGWIEEPEDRLVNAAFPSAKQKEFFSGRTV